MSRKITIIGAGNVGATVAYTLSNEHLASEIVLIDIDRKKLLGEVMDIAQGTGFRDPISVVAGDYEDAKGSDIVIITSGIARKPGQTRIELVQTNVDIIKDITPKIVSQAPNALYIIVSNPVDIITYVFTKISGLPERQVIGSGTLLDTTRLRSTLAGMFNVSQKNIHAYVFGEHGDSSFVPWSRCEVSGSEFDAYVELMLERGQLTERPNKFAITEQIHTSGSQIIANKGATYYAVSVAICRICSMLLAAYDSIVTVSSMMHGEYGIDDVCVSTLSLMGPKGIVGKVPVKLTKYEIGQLQASANKLKEVIAQIHI
ncbi:MAG: L-lactate dehydrogenase [Oscillospiraceae bacterium]|nr:L-lactate dehydrogenase [Oscillospiraceae bacterium]